MQIDYYDKNKLIVRIQKLLRLSQSSNQYEAEQAAAKASALIKEHQISMTQVDMDNQSNESIGEFKNVKNTINRRWVVTLAGACARLFDGQVISYPGAGNFIFVGFEQDAVIAKELFAHLYDSWFSIVKADAEARRTKLYAGGWQFNGTTYRVSHGLGYASAIFNRTNQLVADRQQEVAAASNVGSALIVVKDKALQDYADKQNWRPAKKAVSRDPVGLKAGQFAGRCAALGGSIEA